jgi:signal transduction histidine kinase
MYLESAMGLFTRSIPRRILAALLSIYLATYFATALVVYSGVRASMIESDAAALNHLADLKYDQLVNQIGALATDLTAWSELDVMNDLASGDIDKRVTQALEAAKRLYGLAGEIYAFDAKGRLLASSASARIGAGTSRIPSQWQKPAPALFLLDNNKDPSTGDKIIALEIPVFGTFDTDYRIGTLVLTYPWASIERLLFNPANETVLLEKSGATRVLAISPPSSGDLIGPSRIRRDDWTGSGMVVGRSAPGSGLVANWRVLMLHDTASATRPLRWVAFKLALLGAALGIPIIFLGRWLSHRLTAPIGDLTRVVREIADTDKLDARVPVTSSDELGSLAKSFNTMTANLERTTNEREQFLRELAALNQTLEAKIAARTAELETAVKAQQRLLGDISHEIKSPLARLSMALGLASRSGDSDRPRQFDRMEREIENIAALAGELLILARLDAATAPPEFTAIDLGAIVERIVADAIYEKPDRAGDVIVHDAAQPMTILGNTDLLHRAIENVVRNAVFYTRQKTAVEIYLLRKSPGSVTVEVRDRGPGVPDAALERLFEPFYRVDDARTRETGGTGIGLAICQRVVHLHGGSVHARRNNPTGLIVEIAFPSESSGFNAATSAPATQRQRDVVEASHERRPLPMQ